MTKIEFKELWIADRFKLSNGSLWTKLGTNTARKHSKESINLKEKGYGYIGDTICYFEPEDKVEFVPV